MDDFQRQRSMTSFVFDAVDQKGESVQGTVQAVDEDEVRRKLQQEFGYKVMDIHEKVSAVPAQYEEIKQNQKEENIIFQEQAETFSSLSDIPDDRLSRLHQKIQDMIRAHGTMLSQATRDHLKHLDGKIDLLKIHFHRKHLWSLRWELRKAFKRARKEIAAYEKRKWEEYDNKNVPEETISYTDLSDDVKKKRFQIKTPESFKSIQKWLQIIDQPDEQQEHEVLIKQHYESIWLELQRFSGALTIFYLVCYFIAYYLKRSGFDEAFLVRIYDARLFKQLILSLFLFYALLSLRRWFLPLRVKSDGILLLVWAIFIWWIF